MKPKHILFGMLALFAASCANDEMNEVAALKQNGIQVTAGLTANTRVNFEQDGNVTHALWEEGDQITLYAPSQGYLPYQVSTLSEDAASAIFTPINDALQNTDETIYAAHRADMEADIADGMATLPNTDTWTDEHPLPFAYAISKVADGKLNLSFEHVFAYLKLTLNAETVAGSTNKSIAVIGLSTTSDEPLSNIYGFFNIPEQEYVIEKGSNHMFFSLQEPFTATGTDEKSVYIPILPQSAGKTITINIFGDYEAADTLFTESKEVPSTGFVAGRAYTYSPKSSITRVGNTVTLTEAGTLSKAISTTEKDTITSLKIIGPLNGDDIRFIIEMAGRDIDENATKGKLKHLDIGEAWIVEGGDAYFVDYDGNQHFTSDDVIGDCMFWRCFLKSIILPNDVTSIGNSAFYDCSSLASITIPDGVTSIGNEAFKNCIPLISIDIPNSVTSIGNGAFSSCTGLTSVNMGSGVTSIGERAFIGCEALTSITIPASVVEINGYAFLGCDALTEVTCNAATPPSLGSNVFIASPATLYVPSGTYSAYMASDWAQYFTTIDDGEEHGSYENGVATMVTAGTLSTLIPEDEKYTINSLKVVGPLNGDDIRFIREMAGVDVRGNATEGKLVDLDISEASIVEGGASYYSSGYTSYTTENNVIGELMFAETILERIQLPQNITSIADRSFQFSSLTNISIPNNVTTIGSQVFYNCSSLTDVSIGLGVTTIGASAFSRCTSLANITIPDGIAEIADYTFSECSSLSGVVIGGDVTSIGAYAFQLCTSLPTITLPESLLSIGEEAFERCTLLSKVTCNAATPPTLGSSALKNIASSATLNVPSGTYSAYMASDWAQYFTTIDDGEEHGSYENGVATVVTAGTLSTLIPEEEKYTITKLKVVGPLNGSDIRYIREMAGRDVNGDETEGQLVDLDMSEASIVEGGGEYTGSYYPNDDINACYISSSYTSDNKVGNYMFSLTILKNITLPSNITSIGEGAFCYCVSLPSITIPDGVTSIGEWAFRGCSSLANITIPDGLTSIEDYAFYYCSSLISINIPDGVTSIGSAVFYHCSALPSITLPSSITSIEQSTFIGCYALTSINIPSGVTSIGINAFLGCSSLANITIPDGVTLIENNTFNGCSALTSINIPDGVTSIGSTAFSGCSSLTSIDIPDGVTSIGDNAFSGCFSLLEVTSNASIPPTLGSSCFQNIYSSTLIVPAGTYAAYMASDWAQYFTTIKGENDTNGSDGNVDNLPAEEW